MVVMLDVGFQFSQVQRKRTTFVFSGRDPPEAVQIQLPLKRRKLRLLEEAKQRRNKLDCYQGIILDLVARSCSYLLIAASLTNLPG